MGRFSLWKVRRFWRIIQRQATIANNEDHDANDEAHRMTKSSKQVRAKNASKKASKDQDNYFRHLIFSFKINIKFVVPGFTGRGPIADLVRSL
jgi:hypothetical protein